jgi:hypothetical protein
MQPAYHIPLNDADLRTIGELAAIQAQVEYFMQHVVRTLLQLSHDATLTVMGSTSIRINAEVFIALAREKCSDQNLLKTAEYIFEAVESLSKGRSDFLHALYAIPSNHEKGGFMLSGGIGKPLGEAAAYRTKNFKKTDLSELRNVRDKAAQVSCALAHLDWRLMGGAEQDSPWLGRF